MTRLPTDLAPTYATLGAIGWLAVALPPVERALEASMTTQMLLQFPLLVGVGLLLSCGLPRVALTVATWDVGGITGLSLVSITSAVWMLPRSLDASVTEPLVAAAKYLSVPLLIGLPLGMSWPRMGFVIRGVLLLELIATLFRLGWLYSVWPGRLCSNYLLEDQQQLGRDMLIGGAALLIWMAWKLIWGRFTSLPGHEDTSPLR